MNLEEQALKNYELGFKVIPVDENKKPLCKWKRFQEKQTFFQVKAMNWAEAHGMALLTGGDIEVIDIDSKYAIDKYAFEEKVFDAVHNALGPEVYDCLLVTQTQSGGYHIIYKCEKIEGNQKLASRYTNEDEKKNEADKVRVLLETRGEGGYIIIPPTPKYHFNDESRNFGNVSTLTTIQRDRLMNKLRSFNETAEIMAKSEIKTPFEVSKNGRSTIEAFNEAHTPVELIESIGWEFCHSSGSNDFYVRAGKEKKDGISGCYNNEKGLFYVFTTSSIFDSERAYNAFQIYAYINHQGDQKAASHDLYKQGYGDRAGSNKDSSTNTFKVITTGDEADKEKVSSLDQLKLLENNTFDLYKKPTRKPASLFMKCSQTGKYIGLGGDGDMVTFCGLQKTRKSAAATCAASCFISGGVGTSLNFKAENLEGRNLIYIDTEQSDYEHWLTCKQMLDQQGIDFNPTNFKPYRITNVDKITKVQFLDYIIKKVGNVGCVLLDGVVDLCKNYNDYEGASQLVEWLRRMASIHGFLLINVLHNARSTGKARGHLGTELLNKGTCNINITKDKELGFSTLEIEDLRGSFEPKGFQFFHDDTGSLQLYY